MKKFLTVMSIITAILLAPLGLRTLDKVVGDRISVETNNPTYQKQDVPSSEQALNLDAPKSSDVQKTITLEKRNTVVLRGPVTGSSVASTMKRLREASRNNSKNTPIYLVLDTPGGSIMDGMDLIDFANALPQKVHTVTLFAASMGFMIAQQLDNRYIIRNGTLMSHRASVSGLSGQVKGELETRYKMIRRAVDAIEAKASNRMGLSIKDYDDLVLKEYWVYGFDAVKAKAADEQVLVKCGESMAGSEDVKFETFFGTVVVTFSECPLIKAPEKIDLAGLFDSSKSQEVKQLFSLVLDDKPRFVREYISTNRFFEVFR